MSIRLIRYFFALLCALNLAVMPAGTSHASTEGGMQPPQSVHSASEREALGDPAADMGEADGECSPAQDCVGGCDCAVSCSAVFAPAIIGWSNLSSRTVHGFIPVTLRETTTATNKKPPRVLS